MLNNYNQQPRERNWENIKAQLEEERRHQHIKSKFDNFVPVPSASNWESIQSTLNKPLPNKYNWKLRIAASICLFILAFTLLSDSHQLQLSDLHKKIVFNKISKYDLCQDPEVVALDIVKPVLVKNKKSVKKKIATTKQKRLLDIILAEDEGIASEVDSALIAKLIRPVDILSEESMFASVGGSYFYYREGDDFKKMYYLPEVDYQLDMPTDSLGAILYKVIDK